MPKTLDEICKEVERFIGSDRLVTPYTLRFALKRLGYHGLVKHWLIIVERFDARNLQLVKDRLGLYC
jgi:hypothetical protein